MLGESLSKTGRNDPCPCGSGKKYKKCCAAPKAPDNSPAARIQATLEGLVTELADFLERRFRDNFSVAWDDFYLVAQDEAPIPDEDDEDQVVFLPYVLFHWDPEAPESTTNLVDGGIVARTFLQERSSRLNEMERQIIETLMRQPFSFYEVVSCPRGEDFVARDLCTGQEVTVSKAAAYDNILAGNILYAQMLLMSGVTTMSFTAPLLIPAEMKPPILKYRDMLVEDLELGARNLTLDDVRIQQDELRELYIRILDAFMAEDAEDLDYDAPGAQNAIQDLPDDPALQAKIRGALQKEVNKWPYHEVPALNGKTPLQAIADPEGKKAVATLLADYEEKLQQRFATIIRPNLVFVRSVLSL